MNRKLKIAILFMLGCSLISISGIQANEAKSKTQESVKKADAKPYKKMWAKSFLNKKAPKLETEKWLTDEPETKGKLVLIDFWATWCGPCKKAIPELNKFHKKYKDKLVVIGISDEPQTKMRDYDKLAIKYFSAIDTKGKTKKQFQVKGIPHVVILDTEGIVRWEGFPLLKGHELNEKVVDDLIKKYHKPAKTKKSEATKSK